MYSLDTPIPVLTVSELTAQIRVLIEETFEYVAVTGEISNAKIYPSGHWYFSLKDKEATIPAVCFKNMASFIKFDLEDGLQVVVKGKLSVYPPRGGYQLVVTSLTPVGIGDWQLAFEQLKTKLDKLGLLEPSRKRPIPLLPRKIGVVTSIAGAALHDILSALKRRNPHVQVLISPAKVQGEGSPEEIALAINNLQNQSNVDVIIVARGGGSIEDLWSFNSEIVALAVANSAIPIISGVGHETDVTICDLVADLRAPTPTAAAELVATGYLELQENCLNLNRRLLYALEKKVIHTRNILHKLNPRYALARYLEKFRKMQIIVQSYKGQLIQQITKSLSTAYHRFNITQEKLLALSALNVLSRGYAIIQKLDGTIVRNTLDVKPGESLLARLHSGQLKLKVEEIIKEVKNSG